jgi:hypothetical protein
MRLWPVTPAYILTNTDSDWTDTTGNLPWTSKAIRLKAGSQVTVAVTTWAEDTNPVTCEIISDGRVVAKVSVTGGPTCSARV